MEQNSEVRLHFILFLFFCDIMDWNLIWPILVVIASNTFYNVCMKSTPGDVNPFAALMVTYIVSVIITAIVFVFMAKPENVVGELSKVNWVSVVLAFALVGLEVGYVFVYRAGWQVSNASVVANISLACVLLMVGYFLYHENVSIRQILGIFVCMVGLILINL